MLYMAQAESPPDDLMPASEAAREFGISYTVLRSWWQRGYIHKWNRGPRRRPVYVRRSEVQTMVAFRTTAPDVSD